MKREDNQSNNRNLTFERLFDDGSPIAIVPDPQAYPDIDGLIIDTSVCDNPECPCREMGLHIYQASRSGNMMSREPEASPLVHAAFDVDTGTLLRDETGGVSRPEAERLFDLLEKKIGSYRKVLTQRFHHARSRQVEAWMESEDAR
jgi:hypothetical protein